MPNRKLTLRSDNDNLLGSESIIFRCCENRGKKMKNGYKFNYKLEEKFYQFRDLRAMLRYCADAYTEKVAFITKVKDRDIEGNKETRYINTTYKDFFDDMNYLGTALVDMGFKGKNVAVIGDNSYHWILAYVTAACGVSVTVPLDKGLQKEELESCINRSRSKVIFYDKKQAKVVDQIMNDKNTDLELAVAMDFTAEGSTTIVDLLERGQQLVVNGDRRYIEAEIDPDGLSFLLFTSGTTAQSKAVMLSHKNLMSCNWGMNCQELFFPDDVNMIILPLHHIYGFSGLLTFLSQGLTNVFCDGLKYITINMSFDTSFPS